IAGGELVYLGEFRMMSFEVAVDIIESKGLGTVKPSGAGGDAPNPDPGMFESAKTLGDAAKKVAEIFGNAPEAQEKGVTVAKSAQDVATMKVGDFLVATLTVTPP